MLSLHFSHRCSEGSPTGRQRRATGRPFAARALTLTGLMLAAASTASAAATTNSPAGKPAAASTAPAGADEPSVTTASFADWTLRCQRAGPTDHPVRLCEVGAVMRMPGQSAPIAQVAIGRLSRNEPLRFTALLPPNVSFPSAVHIKLGDKDDGPLDLAWRRCLASACVAEADMRDETLDKWRGAGEPARLSFTDATGRTLTIPMPMSGLSQALAALAREPL